MTKVFIIESERGWGNRIDETRRFSSRKKAETFVTKFNKSNDKAAVPDWYMYAQIEDK